MHKHPPPPPETWARRLIPRRFSKKTFRDAGSTPKAKEFGGHSSKYGPPPIAGRKTPLTVEKEFPGG